MNGHVQVGGGPILNFVAISLLCCWIEELQAIFLFVNLTSLQQSDAGVSKAGMVNEVRRVLLEEIMEEPVAKVRTGLHQHLTTLADLLCPPFSKIFFHVIVTNKNLPGKRIGCISVGKYPVNAGSWTIIANLLASCSKWALAMSSVNFLEQLHHTLLIALRQVSIIIRPRHVQPQRATMDAEKGGWCKFDDQLFDDLSLWLAEWPPAAIQTTLMVIIICLLPVHVPVAVEVDTMGIIAQTILACLYMPSRLRIAIQDQLKLGVAQDRCWFWCTWWEWHIPTKDPQKM
mmetsp:Transcript_78452/g.155425  ORF Transcript_78452/g.155425 Transcript_78452/m.155425 type:complete len:287 (-) Transcript_78452:461-1321(-)